MNWKRFFRRGPEDTDQDERQAAKRAVSDSEDMLQEVRAKDAEVSAASNRMKELRELNHFGQAIENSMRLKGWHPTT